MNAIETAIALGAKPITVAKWRQRGVPAKWQIKLRDAGVSRAAIEAVKRDATRARDATKLCSPAGR